ncbi:MAG: uridine kinase family protein [Oscillospiraceae bacterium]
MRNDLWTALFLLHFARYPNSGLQDFYKLMFQSVFGPGHLISPSREEEHVSRIRSEMRNALPTARLHDPIGNGLSRIHLGALPAGISPERVNRAVAAAAAQQGDRPAALDDLAEGYSALLSLCRESLLPFSPDDLARTWAGWQGDGYPPVPHSDVYQKAYAPSYRVVWVQFPRYLPLFSAIDQTLAQKGRCVVAIDGGSGAGKSTLALQMQKIYGCTVLHMDDFFLPAHRKTAQRLETPGGNVDWERFLQEVGPALLQNTPVSYQRFDCKRQALQPPERLPAAPLTVIEGAYSLHPQLRHLYHITVFLALSEQTQKARIRARNDSMFTRFLQEWIPLEQAYCAAFALKQNSTFCFSAEDEF